MTSTEQTDAQKSDEPIDLASSAVADVFERLGLKRTLGRIWVVLYMSRRPQDAVELQQMLQISAGSLSTGSPFVLRRPGHLLEHAYRPCTPDV